MERAEQSERYAALAAEVIDARADLRWIRNAAVSIGYLSSDREKKAKGNLVLGECIRVKELYKCFIPYDFLIVIYEPNVCRLSEDQLRILLYHELLHVDVEEKNGEPVYRINPHDTEDFARILREYGFGWAEPGNGPNSGTEKPSDQEVTDDGERKVPEVADA